MKRLTMTFTFAALLFAGNAAAQEFTKPIRYTWIVASVDHWNKAASALTLSGGDGTVVAFPTGNDSRPWILLRRVEEGSMYVPDDEPYTCDVFKSASDASSRYLAMNGCHSPMMMTLPDGNSVVIGLRDCGAQGRRRAVRN